MRGARLWCLLGILAAFAAAEARAHNLGDSYLYLQIYEDSITGRFEIALSDLNPALGLSGTELEITPENLDERIGFLQHYYREHVTIADPGGPLSIEFTGHSLLGARGGYVLLPFELGGLDGVPDRLTFDYSVLFDEEPSHRGFLLVEHNWATGTFANENRVSLVFTPSSRRQEFDLTSSGRLRGFLALARLGAEHMLLGLDHVMFLLALLLPAVLRREDGTWRAVDRFAAALGNVVGIVTAFLVAHAVALSLVALAGVRLPEPLVETVIAASIVLAAVNILRPLFPRPSSPSAWEPSSRGESGGSSSLSACFTASASRGAAGPGGARRASRAVAAGVQPRGRGRPGRHRGGSLAAAVPGPPADALPQGGPAGGGDRHDPGLRRLGDRAGVRRRHADARAAAERRAEGDPVMRRIVVAAGRATCRSAEPDDRRGRAAPARGAGGAL